jgi:hypothetical protein
MESGTGLGEECVFDHTALMRKTSPSNSSPVMQKRGEFAGI